ncbi:ABC transporter ATP-binding protein [Geminocystis sp. CENA526]|uniref:ABC transporter ATP-binding protein n=1 Tax=Geminocystis sp. CENA526 TaxID=1355871 RepID=UPI003D6DE242
MSDTIITVENLGKKYVIAHEKPERYTALRDVIANGAKSFGEKLFKGQKTLDTAEREEFWALKDVSFEIKRGDRVGIIGRNGAGKSTLLKILSRITEPTTGKISIKGRVASLLEVGTGFHPELTGRENIFLNGAILGMSKAEIKKKFDEIVAFAEVEKFLDTPVKRYSSGMYVRLAFAVAAHLEPEILIVDEVLAVGDAQFQKKCLGKMEDVAQNEGRTVLFVSHQMAAIQKLCSRTLVLSRGEVKFDGITSSGINFYLQDLENSTRNVEIVNLPRSGNGDIRLTGFCIKDSDGHKVSSVACGEDINLCFYYEARKTNIKNVSLGFSIHNIFGDTISVLYSDYMGYYFNVNSSKGCFQCKIRDFPYSNGRYFIGVRIISNGIELDWPKGFIGCLDVEAGDFYKTGTVNHSGIGSVLIRGNWFYDSLDLEEVTL